MNAVACTNFSTLPPLRSQKFGTELCISVSNLSRKQGEYMHVTTTPELPIKYAIRASMSIPFVFEPMSMADKGHGMHTGKFDIVRYSAAAPFVKQYLKLIDSSFAFCLDSRRSLRWWRPVWQFSSQCIRWLVPQSRLRRRVPWSSAKIEPEIARGWS